MGFGKFLLGGVCAMGAVIAAPVVVPVAGLGLATSTLVASGTGLAVAAAAAGSAQEKRIGEAYERGRRSGYEEAADEFEKKYRKQ